MLSRVHSLHLSACVCVVAKTPRTPLSFRLVSMCLSHASPIGHKRKRNHARRSRGSARIHCLYSLAGFGGRRDSSLWFRFTV